MGQTSHTPHFPEMLCKEMKWDKHHTRHTFQKWNRILRVRTSVRQRKELLCAFMGV